MTTRFVLTLSSLAVAICITFIVHLTKPAPQLSDTKEYYLAAHNLLTNNTLYAGDLLAPTDYRLYSKRTLGYPVFLIFQWQNKYLVLVASLLLFILLFFIGLQLLKKHEIRSASFFIYVLLFAFHVALLIHTTFQMADLTVAVIVTGIVAIQANVRITKPEKYRAMAILWALGLLLKPVFLPSLLFIPMALLYVKLQTARWQWILCLPLLVWVCGSFVNFKNTGVYEYSSISTINFGQYNAKLMLANDQGIEAANHFTSSKAFEVPRTSASYRQYKKAVKQAALAAMQDHPLAYAKVHLAGIAKMLLDPGRFEMYTFFGINDYRVSLTELAYGGKWEDVKTVLQKNSGVFITFLLLTFLALIKLFTFMFSLLRFTKLVFPLTVIVYFLAITGPVGAARFMLPVSIVYLVLVVIGAGWVSSFFYTKNTK